jgi:ectoine hydroxylase-related dioxygenase (phytanoyl-CoA dioxygenase family)
MALTPAVAEYVGPSSAIARAAAQAGVDPAPVRIVAFNKSPTSNWAVAWHQDRVIAVDERCDEPGYTNWVMKDDVWHCEPPIELLHKLVFVRVHFDACDETNGAMEIAVGSHRMGLVDARRAKEVAEAHQMEVCRAAPGDVLLVKALTLHRSGSSVVQVNRRALRVDYARRRDLAARLNWSLPAS